MFCRKMFLQHEIIKRPFAKRAKEGVFLGIVFCKELEGEAVLSRYKYQVPKKKRFFSQGSRGAQLRQKKI